MTQPAAAPRSHPFPPQLWTELSGASLIASEAVWVALFYQVLTQSASSLGLAVLVLAAIGLLSHYLSRLSSGDPTKARARIILSGIWIVLCLTISARLLYFGSEAPGLWQSFWQLFSNLFVFEERTPAFAHTLIIVLLILRGVRLSRTPITLGFNQTSFQISAAAFLLFGTIYNHALKPGAFIAFGVYLFLALSGMTFGRIAYLGQTRGGKLPPFGWSWLGKISTAVLGIVSLVVLTGFLISGKIANTLATLVVSILGVLAIAAAYVLTPIMQVVIGFILQLLERTPGSDLMVGPESREGFSQAEEAAGREAIFSNIVELLQSILPVIILVIVVILIVSSLGWRPWSRKPQAVEEDLTTVKPVNQPDRRESRSFLPGWVNPSRLLAAARIRRIYGQLMDLMVKLDHPRPPAVTPLEFLPRLTLLFPEEKENVNIITQAYLKIRYGETPEDPQEVEDVVGAWKRVNQQGRVLLAQKKAAARSRPR